MNSILKSRAIRVFILAVFVLTSILTNPTVHEALTNPGLSFNGANSYFTINSQLNLGSGDFTIEVDAKVDSFSSGIAQIYTKRLDGNIELQVRANRQVEVVFGNSTSADYLSILTPEGTIEFGTYYHYSVVRQGGNLYLYINDVLKGSISFPTSMDITNMQSWYIGSDFWYGEFLKGNISEFRIWDKARTLDEIKASINQTLQGNESNLIGLWRFDPYTTEKVYDRSPRGNHAIGNGFASPPILQTKQEGEGVTLTIPSSGYNHQILRNGEILTTTSLTTYKDMNAPKTGTSNYQYRVITTNGESIVSQPTTFVYGPSTSLKLTNRSQKFSMQNIPVNTNPDAKNTVEFWMKWDGVNYDGNGFMPFSFSNGYTLYVQNGALGFNTAQGDIFGVPFSKKNEWVHIAAVFNNGAINSTTVKLYLNGVKQTLGQYGDVAAGSVYSRNVTNQVTISGWSINNDYGFIGEISNYMIWNHERTESQINQDMIGAIGNSSGLVGNWIFDPVTTSQSFDQSAYDNHANGTGFTPASSLTASNITDMGMDISWSTVSGATAYELMRDNTLIHDSSGTMLKENKLVSDTVYSYSIQAKNNNGKSGFLSSQFRTNVGELSIIEVPSSMQTTGITLNGNVQKVYGTMSGKIRVKDTRKVRNGWRLVVKSNPLVSTSGKLLPNTLSLKPISSISQTEGQVLTNQPTKATTSVQPIDVSNSITLVSAASTTGYGIYEITFPIQALEGTIPASAYSGNYSTSLTWEVVAGS